MKTWTVQRNGKTIEHLVCDCGANYSREIPGPPPANSRLQSAAGAVGARPDIGDDCFDDMCSGLRTPWQDWRSHVPAVIVTVWRQLTHEARLATYLTAVAAAAYRELAGYDRELT